MLDLIGWYKPAADTWKFHGGRALFKYPLGTPSMMPPPDRLGQWLSTGTISLPLPGDIWTFGSVWRHHWLSQLGGRDCDQHPAGRGQRCCWTSCSARGSPPQQTTLWPQMPVVPRLRSLDSGQQWTFSGKTHWTALVNSKYVSLQLRSLGLCSLWCTATTERQRHCWLLGAGSSEMKMKLAGFHLIYHSGTLKDISLSLSAAIFYMDDCIGRLTLYIRYVPEKLFIKSYFKYSQEIH